MKPTSKIERERIKKREALQTLRQIAELPGPGAARARRLATATLEFIEAMENEEDPWKA